MDIDVNRPIPHTKIYEVEGIQFRGVSPSQMIADKISVVSSDKVFRRVKDVVDLYYLSKTFELDKVDITQTLKDSKKSIDDFTGFLYRTGELRHSYEKFRFAGDANKPPFEEVYNTVKLYIKDIIPREKTEIISDEQQNS